MSRNKSKTKPSTSAPTRESAKAAPRERFSWLLLAGVLIGIVFLAYIPVYDAGFIWDDDDYVIENMTLRDWNGLARIWFDPTATPQYYPLVHTTLWIDFQLWKNTSGDSKRALKLHFLGGGSASPCTLSM
jgi:ABC-type polysaccharide transport system permease subunit